MKLIKVDIPQVRYQFRHWFKWYWIMEDGEIVKINQIIKEAKEIDGR